MTRIFTFFVICLLSSFSLADGKVAVVNYEEAILNTDYAQKKLAELEADKDFMANMDEANKIKDEGQKLAKKYEKEGPTMSAAQKREFEEKIQTLQADLQHVAKKNQDAMEKLYKNLMYELLPAAKEIVKGIIEAEGIGLLLNGSMRAQVVLHSDTSFEISAKVTDKLNKQLASK